MNRYDTAERIQQDTGVRVEWNPLGGGTGEYVVGGMSGPHYASEARKMAKRIAKEHREAQDPWPLIWYR